MSGDRVEPPRRGLRYLLALDGLRGVAIILVLLHNLTMTSATTEPFLGRVLEWGWVGVQLFFVMSGFLITRNLLAAQFTPRMLAAFMIRRWLRIVPICYVLLAVYFYVVPRFFDAPGILAARPIQVWYWMFVSNWTEPAGLTAPGLGHLWSLAVEVQFYLVWPFVVMLVGPRRLARACVAVAVMGFVAAVALRLVGASYMAVYKFTLTRMNALALGALVAAVSSQQPPARIPVRALAWSTVAALLVIVVWRHGFDYADVIVETVGFTLIAVLFALWLLPITGVIPGAGTLAVRVPSTAWVRSVGRVSYGMYVLHYPLHWVAMQHVYPYLLAGDGQVVTWRLLVYVAIASVTTYLLARLLWIVVERPVLALKRYFPPTGVRNPTIQIKTLSAGGQ